MAFNYNNLTLSELINKIDTSRFFNLPKMVAEALKKLQSLISANEPKYKVYTALLTQTDTNAPVATVLENTLGGEVVWSYEGEGSYSANLAGAFTEDKTVAFIQQTSGQGATSYIAEFNTDFITVETADPTDTLTDGELDASPFEIRVYN